ncbi:hypothetical protein Bbelb_404850 [Branchiostoma belcheri]|nr:hypothetical protein Bbelb_404850 [Branchiostoma belcheri]
MVSDQGSSLGSPAFMRDGARGQDTKGRCPTQNVLLVAWRRAPSLVFIVHVNKLPGIIDTPSWSFVDDLNVIESRPWTSWTVENKMKLNPGKCKAMHICFSRNPPPPPALNIDGHLLKVVKVAKCLGVSFQEDLKWDTHITDTTKKGNQRRPSDCLYVFCPRRVGVRCATDWIENIQRRATKIILGKNFTNYSSALKVLKLQTLEDRRVALCAKFAKKDVRLLNSGVSRTCSIQPCRNSWISKMCFFLVSRLQFRCAPQEAI